MRTSTGVVVSVSLRRVPRPPEDSPQPNARRPAGDRLRGIKFSLKVAYISDRVLLISDSKPVPLQSILAPSALDWTLDGLTVGSEKDLFWYENAKNATLTDYSWFQSDIQFIYLHTNFAADTALNPSAAKLKPPPSIVGDSHMNAGGGFTRTHLLASSCMMRALFRASAPLQADYTRMMAGVLNATGPLPPYAAMHFRCGGMGDLGEDTEVRRTGDNIRAFVNGLACVRLAAHKHHITAPIVVLTDNKALRKSIIAGYFGTRVVTTGARAVHIDWLPTSDNKTTEHIADWVARETRTIYADLMVLTGARCLVAASRSGFSNLAHGWGALDYFYGHTHECLKAPLHASLRAVFNLPHKW